ncbi:type I-C CRISPR-associated protein Cas5 [Ectothiorhodospiraceae bacterium BW-2]|nr:type I-C CRISPR-associated protein Cas5 [Ectothiorhodospiraceae bacterium BW-2]
MQNSIQFKVSGRYALFTDPVTRVGGEKCSYHLPTYEAIKGITKSIYWKPTIIWVVDRVRVIKPLRTQTKGTKPIKYQAEGNDLAIYTFLRDVEYQVEAHFEWNEHRPELTADRNPQKHLAIAQRMVERGGRQDIFLGTRDCQGYVEPCTFGEGKGAYDEIDELGFGVQFHGFDYPDESGNPELVSRFWQAVMQKGVIHYPRPEGCTLRRHVRKMEAKPFELDENQCTVADEEEQS